MDWLGAVGSVASILGGIWSWKQAINARKSASEAENVKRGLIDRSEVIELSQLQTKTAHISKIIAKLGPACTKSSLRGVDCQGIAQELQDYTSFLREHLSVLEAPARTKAQDVYDALLPVIKELARAETFEQKREAGGEANLLIEGLMPELKLLVDKKRIT